MRPNVEWGQGEHDEDEAGKASWITERSLERHAKFKAKLKIFILSSLESL